MNGDNPSKITPSPPLSPWHDPNAELADLARAHLIGCHVSFDSVDDCVRVHPTDVWVGCEITVKRFLNAANRVRWWDASLRFGPKCYATDSTPAGAITSLINAWFNFDRGVEVLRISRADQVCRVVSDGLSARSK